MPQFKTFKTTEQLKPGGFSSPALNVLLFANLCEIRFVKEFQMNKEFAYAINQIIRSSINRFVYHLSPWQAGLVGAIFTMIGAYLSGENSSSRG